MLNNVLDQRRLGDSGDDTHMATAAGTRADVNREHPAKSLHPAHRAVRLGLLALKRLISQR